MLKGNKTGRPVLVVKYEDLKSDSLTQVKRMLEFLKVPYSDEELKKRLSEDFKTFHRSHTNDDFDHFTPYQRKVVLEIVKEVVMMLKEQNNGQTYGIEEYLNSIRIQVQ